MTYVALFMALGACAVSPKQSYLEQPDLVQTASIVEPTLDEGVEESDAEIIKSVVSSSQDSDQSNSLAWRNPETGNEGTVTAIEEFIGSNGQKCKKFQTTADTFMGISIYDGETCEMKRGFWGLVWLKKKMAQ